MARPEATFVPAAAAAPVLVVRRDPPAAGAENMAADEALAEEAVSRGIAVVRLYGWTEPTVSLGAFQAVAAARAIPAIAAAPLVRRPSGGGAIVHGDDVTYALALPVGHALARAAEPLYAAVHGALVAALGTRGIAARMHGGGAGGAADSFFCFDRRAAADVVVARPGRPEAADDPKILGSAQRRLRGAVIQHGSLLVEARRALPGPRHQALADIHPGAFAAEVLVADWMERLASSLGGTVAWEPAAAAPPPGFTALLSRFSDDRWLERR